jgi:protein TonB
MVQQITVLTPPPPPPPPPPQEQIEEPEVQEEPIKDETQAPPDDAAEQSPAQDLGVDAEGGAGGDSFGLVGRKGGQGLLGGGGYEQHVRQEINEFILEDARLKRMDYVAVLTLKIGDGGEFEQFEVEIVNGNTEAADIIRKILRDKRKLAKPRPLEAASVVKLRVKSVL